MAQGNAEARYRVESQIGAEGVVQQRRRSHSLMGDAAGGFAADGEGRSGASRVAQRAEPGVCDPAGQLPVAAAGMKLLADEQEVALVRANLAGPRLSMAVGSRLGNLRDWPYSRSTTRQLLAVSPRSLAC
jgi:hypothetical protein